MAVGQGRRSRRQPGVADRQNRRPVGPADRKRPGRRKRVTQLVERPLAASIGGSASTNCCMTAHMSREDSTATHPFSAWPSAATYISDRSRSAISLRAFMAISQRPVSLVNRASTVSPSPRKPRPARSPAVRRRTRGTPIAGSWCRSGGAASGSDPGRATSGGNSRRDPRGTTRTSISSQTLSASENVRTTSASDPVAMAVCSS